MDTDFDPNAAREDPGHGLFLAESIYELSDADVLSELERLRSHADCEYEFACKEYAGSNGDPCARHLRDRKARTVVALNKALDYVLRSSRRPRVDSCPF